MIMVKDRATYDSLYGPKYDLLFSLYRAVCEPCCLGAPLALAEILSIHSWGYDT